MKRTFAAAGLAAVLLPILACAADAAPIPSIVKPKQTYRLGCTVNWQSVNGVIIVRNTADRVIPLDATIEIRLTIGKQYPHFATRFVPVTQQAKFGKPSSIAPGESRWMLSHANARSCSAKVTLSRYFAR